MDEQVELLRAIYSEMKALNERVDTTNATLDREVGGLRVEFKEEIGALRTEFGGLRIEFGGLRAEVKEEITGLRSDFGHQLGGLRAEFGEQIGGLRSDFGHQLGGLRAEFKEELGELRFDLKSEGRRSVDRDLRLGTALAELSLDVRELTGIVHAWRDEHRVDREELRERVARLERRVGLEPP
jgi:hypothetical protein